MHDKMRGNLMLILTAMIWGLTFVAQKSGVEIIGPFSFNAARILIGGIVLVPVIKFLDRFKNKTSYTAAEKTKTPPGERKTLIVGGICCGLALMPAINVQQIGLIYTTAGKAGFITALYVVLVPILGLFLRKKVRPVIWLCVAAFAVGLYFLSIPAGSGFDHVNKGDLLMIASAFLFAVHILIVDHFSPKVDGVKLSCVQFFTAGILSLACIWIDPMFGFALPTVSGMLTAWLPILYAGILSCGVAYTLQIVAQARTDPTTASMIMCLESVFAVIAGMLLLKESMTMREIMGCLIMFAALIVSQLPDRSKLPVRKE